MRQCEFVSKTEKGFLTVDWTIAVETYNKVIRHNHEPFEARKSAVFFIRDFFDKCYGVLVLGAHCSSSGSIDYSLSMFAKL